MNIFNIFLGLFLISTAYTNPTCKSFTDPNFKSFDGNSLSFQYVGDHYIMYDDFKDTRVTASFGKCGNGGSCNCAAYLKKRKSLVFMDFCNVTNPLSPTSRFYGVQVEKNAVGMDALRNLNINSCNIILQGQEDIEGVWKNIPTYLSHFKCARLQGFNNYGTVVIRTNELNFRDSVKMKVQFTKGNMPSITITPSVSSFKNTGGLCGLWDDSRENDYFVMDKNGVDHFTSDLSTLERYWKLNSRFNKDQTVIKRCPECFLMAERSFYCPCDDFNLFDNTNYDLELQRQHYCKVPMAECIERKYGFENTTGQINITNPTITEEEAFDICSTGIYNSTLIEEALDCGIDLNATVQFCVSDIINSGNVEFLNEHLQILTDSILEQVLLEANENGKCQPSPDLCPDKCNNHGTCLFKYECLNQTSEECLRPLYCKCEPQWGGPSCSIDKSNFTSIHLDKTCCDLRTEECDFVEGFGSPLSITDTIKVQVRLIETINNGQQNVIVENIDIKADSENSFSFKINKIKELALYKSIKGLPSNVGESAATVQIIASYDYTKIPAVATYTLYDSKCRQCSQGGLTSQPNTCEINGVCYLNGQLNPTLNHLVCDSVNPNEWTQVYDPLCSHLNGSQWSDWINIDNPSGDGDLELIALEQNLPCRNPNRIQFQTTEGVAAEQTGQVLHIDSCYGFICLNREQPNNQTCYDYRFRYCCQADQVNWTTPATTTTTKAPIGSCTLADDYTTGEDCSKYLRCINGNFVLYTCPPGLFWDSLKRKCTPDSQVCNQTVVPVTTVPITSTTSTAQFSSTVTVVTSTIPNNEYPSLEHNFPLKNLTNSGFQCLYDEPYSHRTELSDLENIKSHCDQSSVICVGGVENGGDYFSLVSCGNCLNILSNYDNLTYDNRAYWYLNPLLSFGFAPNSDVDFSNIVDTYDCQTVNGGWSCTDNNRLSWALNGLPGWRLGNIVELDGENYYKKICVSGISTTRPVEETSTYEWQESTTPVEETSTYEWEESTTPVEETSTYETSTDTTTLRPIVAFNITHNITVSELEENSYTCKYNTTYENPTEDYELEAIKWQCTESTILCAGASSQSTTIDLLACGNCQQILNTRTITNTANLVNGVYWYYHQYAFGFSPSSDIKIEFADVYDCINPDGTKWTCRDDSRLSWPLGGLQGWRLGTKTEVNSPDYFKYIFLSNY